MLEMVIVVSSVGFVLDLKWKNQVFVLFGPPNFGGMDESNGHGTSPMDISPPIQVSSQEQAPTDLEIPVSASSVITGADNQKENVDDTDKSIMQQDVSPPQDQTIPTSLENVNELAPRTEDILVGSSRSDGSAPELLNASAATLSNTTAEHEDNGSISAVDIQVNNNHETNGEKVPDMETSQVRSSDDLNQHQLKVEGKIDRTQEANVQPEDAKPIIVNRGLVDTAAPFESVREAVSKFGGIVDWKAHKAITIEKRKHVELELQKAQEEIPEYKKQSEAAEGAKAQVLWELESTKRLIEELKLNLEKAQTEEAQAKQDSELARLRLEEMEQGITDEVSVAAKTQLDVAKARYAAAVVDLKTVKGELIALQAEYVSLVKERDMAVLRAEAAVSASKEIEKTAEEELVWLNEQLVSAKDLKSKLDTASKLLLDLKAELAAYMDAKLKEEVDANKEVEEDGATSEAGEVDKSPKSAKAMVALTKKELNEVEFKIEKAKDEVKCLKVAAVSLQSELESEKTALATMRQREGMASIAVLSLEAELSRTKEEIELTQMKEREAREKMVELPKELQKAAQEADQAKLEAQSMREELRKAREEAEQAKAGETTIESRLNAALKEIEAARASERLALAAFKALQESEENISDGVMLPLDEYYELSKQAHEAEELANQKVGAAVAQIEVAQQSHSQSLERLEEANKELSERREALKAAMEKAERAKKGKLGVEQELRKWRADHEQRRKVDAAAAAAPPPPPIPSQSPMKSFDEGREGRKSVDNDLSSVVHVRHASSPKMYDSHDESDVSFSDFKDAKKKKSFFPKFVKFLAGKKGPGQSPKQ
ncbi:Protein WEAK CHLOROPLAST MOVEMENT UNDER BLUE LIGHT-like 3 [Acorus gramineus]|uniref:Protein WEAK CHLOROPLAST MOVEMENT UNDER BLUE LIGHT-like 3 n=1 Tax=Acorus gramineus TaxID=55184 RepID=A0AAV9AJF2_ACOGR|nr:Protein WEAK CHLOROPLAST MOVEMENT UNDER BLUE LIGHT-like 3 [Acorus gramineus]